MVMTRGARGAEREEVIQVAEDLAAVGGGPLSSSTPVAPDAKRYDLAAKLLEVLKSAPPVGVVVDLMDRRKG